LTTGQNSGGWLAAGTIVLGAFCIGIGVWILSWAPETIPSVLTVATLLPTATTVVTPTATATPAALPTLRATATSTFAPVPTATWPSPDPTTSPTEIFQLRIVHSNDTWGYTLPCG